MSAAGFQRDIQRCSAGGLLASEGEDFGMGTAGLLMPALVNDLSAADQHGADSRIRAGPADATLGELQRQLHETFVVSPKLHVPRIPARELVASFFLERRAGRGDTISDMETIGEILRAARHNKQVSLEDVSRATKIKMETLEKLEADDFIGLAAPMYTKGFLKIYSDYLGIDSAGMVAAYLKSQGGLRRQGLQLETEATLRARQASEFHLPVGLVLRAVVAVSALALVLVAGYQLWTHRQALTLPAQKPVALPVADFEAYYQAKTQPASATLEPPVK